MAEFEVPGRRADTEPESEQMQPATRRRRAIGARMAASSRSWVRANWLVAGALTWIAIFGFVLRVENVNWDEGQHLHPDERFLMIVTSDMRSPGSIGEYFNSETSEFNPYNKRDSFVYGTFPLFVNKAVAEWLDRDVDGSTHQTADWFRGTLQTLGLADMENDDGTLIFDGGYNSQTVGRVISAIFDVLTILLLFELARVLFNKRVGLLAAALLSVTVLNIQYSHFFGSETFLTFFVTAVIYFSVRIWKYGGWPNYLFAGVAIGFALATKLSAMPVLLMPALAIIMHTWPQIAALYRWLAGGRPARQRDELAPTGPARVDWAGLLLPALGGIGILAMAGLVFRIAQPYAFASTGFFDVFAWNLSLRDDVLNVNAIRHLEFLKPKHYFDLSEKYRKDIGNLLQQQSGSDFPPNVQWIGRTKFVFPASNIVLWGLGLPLAAATAGGMIFGAWRIVKRRDFATLLPIIWIALLFLFIGRGFNPTMRYFLPMYPMMVLLAAYAIVSLWDYARSGRAAEMASRLPVRFGSLRGIAAPAMATAAALAVIGAFVWGLAFIDVYRQDISRVQATNWICENMPPGSALTSNQWDDGLPLSLPGGCTSGEYEPVELTPYVPDWDETKVFTLVDGLDRADYVVESSNRLYDSIPRLPARYPNTVLYYKYLFDGTLGFEKVAEFDNYPRLFGIIDVPDQSSEEAFTVYDHPRVTIWKKTDTWDRTRALSLLMPELSGAAVQVTPGNGAQNALYFTPDVRETQAEGGTYSDLFKPNSFFNDHPLIVWLLAMELAALALVPIAVMLFRGLPDRGFLLTKPLGVLVLSYLAYAPASVGLMKYTRTEIALGLAFMLIVGAATAWLWRGEVASWFKARWRFIALCESIFLLTFVGAYWVRMQNPDLWHPARGGEKPMDYAYFNGVLRTTDLTQGPIDPWHAGGYLNYYYFGQFISATVTKLTAIVPEVAYNLIVPMFFALAAAATFSVAYNLADATRQFMKRRPGGKHISAGGPIVAGLMAIFLVLLAGNLKAVQHLYLNLDKISRWHTDIAVLRGPVSITGGFVEIIFGDATLRQVAYGYDWWDPSRALDVVNPATEVTPISEFPFWTFLFADLHAHLMAIPFALTALGVGVGVVLNFSRLNPVRLDARNSVRTREIASWSMVIILGLIVGALRWINTWDFPPFLLLAAAALFIGERTKYGAFTRRAIGMGALKSFVMAAFTVAFFLPLSSNYNAFYSSTDPSTQTTALSDFFSHFGILLLLSTGFIIVMLQRSLSRNREVRAVIFGGRRSSRPIDTLPVMAAMMVGAAGLMWYFSPDRGGVIALSAIGLVGVALAAWREMRNPSPMAPIFLMIYAMMAIGLGLSGGVEIITLEGDIGRMNTVFKFYLHVWLLWGIVSAYGLWYIFGVLQPQEAFLRRAGAFNAMLIRVPRYGFAAATVLVLALALVYPYFGTRARIHDRFDPAQGASNNGMDYMDNAVYSDGSADSGVGGEHVLKYDRDGIQWLRANVEGTPAIIEGTTPLYHWGSRIAIYTGMPTVLGWDHHQRQQRAAFGETIRKRGDDVNLFYGTLDIQVARTILRRYYVEYVIVGNVERNYYPGGLAKFEDGLGGALELAYENPGIQIWHVIPEEELPDAANVAR